MLIKLTSDCGEFWLSPLVREQFKHEISFLYFYQSLAPEKEGPPDQNVDQDFEELFPMQSLVGILFYKYLMVYISSVQLLSHVWLFVTPWTAARQASLSITNSQSLLKLMSTESVMPTNHLIFCRPLLPQR